MNKINWRIRIKNIYFWLAIIGVIFTAMGVKVEMFTSWNILFEQLKELINNPFMLGSVILSVVGVINDPTTYGITDSGQALQYVKPKKDSDLQ